MWCIRKDDRQREMAKFKYNYNDFYHSQEWRAVRRAVLERDHYLCQTCKRNGIIKTGNTVDHIVPVRVDWSKRLDIDNLETICTSCHNKKHERNSKNKFKKVKAKKSDDIFYFDRNPELF